MSQPRPLFWLRAGQMVSISFVLSAKQSSRTSNFNVFCLTRPGIEPPTSSMPGERSTTTLPGRGVRDCCGNNLNMLKSKAKLSCLNQVNSMLFLCLYVLMYLSWCMLLAHRLKLKLRVDFEYKYVRNWPTLLSMLSDCFQSFETSCDFVIWPIEYTWMWRPVVSFLAVGCFSRWCGPLAQDRPPQSL